MLTRLEEFKIEVTNQISVILAAQAALLLRVQELENLLYESEGEDEGAPDAPETGE